MVPYYIKTLGEVAMWEAQPKGRQKAIRQRKNAAETPLITLFPI
jgi:hypothetical protein